MDNEEPKDNINQPSFDPSSFSEEQIENYRKKIIDSLKEEIDISDPDKLLQLIQGGLFNDTPSLDRPNKLLICPHEIVFTLIAHVMEENDKGELVSSKEICKKNYHIPVPPEHDYNKYMDAFFKHVEGCICSSAKNATKQSEKKDE